MIRPTRSPVSRRLAALAAGGVLTATACAPVHAGAAATVGGDRIGMDQVRAVSAQVYTGVYASSTTEAVAQRTIVARLIARVLDDRLAAQEHVATPTGAEVEAAYQSDVAQAGGAAELADAAAQQGYGGDELMTEEGTLVLEQRIAQALLKTAPPTTADLRALYEQYSSQLAGASFASVESELATVYAGNLLRTRERQLAQQVGVHVNSRFGSWSNAQGTAVADLTPLSTPGTVAAPALDPTLTAP